MWKVQKDESVKIYTKWLQNKQKEDRFILFSYAVEKYEKLKSINTQND